MIVPAASKNVRGTGGMTDDTDAGGGQRLVRNHDQFAKRLLDQPGNADAFLRERLPEGVAARLTAAPAVDRSESFVDPLLAEHRGDRVYALETDTGTPILVWALIEHKSGPEPDGLIQTLAGLTGIATRGAVRRENPDRTVWQVPAPVFAVVLYHGARRWTLPRSLAEAYGLPAELAAAGLLDFRYTLVDLGAVPDAELSRHPPLQAGLLVLKYAARDDDPMATLERLVAAAAGLGLTAVVLVVRYLFKASEFADRARLRAVLARILPGQEDEVVSTVAQELMAEGEAKGLVRGKAEGKADMLLRLLGRRFGPVAPEVAARVRAADDAQLDVWADRVLDAETLEAVFAPNWPH